MSTTSNSKIKTVFLATCRQLVCYSIIILLFYFISRVIEYIHPSESGLLLNTLTHVFFNDIIFTLSLFAFLFIPALILAFLSPKLMNIIIGIIYLFAIIMHICLGVYFFHTSIPLGSDLFGYSVQDIIFTAKAGGGISLEVAAGFVFSIGFFITLAIYLPKKLQDMEYNTALIVVILSFAGLLDSIFANPNPSHYSSEYDYYFSTNKSSYFIGRSFSYFIGKHKTDVIDTKSLSSNDNGFAVIDPQYPFLHKDAYADVLKPFFTKGNPSNPPNIVIIVLESIGKAYSGPDAYLGSFTPFMDSLAGRSLYWENCLSGGGRSFAALPSLLGSLPFLNAGYMDEGVKAPKANSTVKILTCNGYTASLYYGGHAYFDKMDTFMRMQGGRVGLDKDGFSSNYKTMPANSGGFSWGYNDHDLFEKYFDIIDSIKTPRLDVIVSISNHSPFIIYDQDKYFNKVKKRMIELGLTDDKKQYLNNYLDQLSTTMYTDEALAYFFKEYAKRSSFKNTIFIITGDHRMPEIPISTQIDRFHVPLYIYSPLLKRTALLKSVVTHLDVTPTLLTFLKDNYQIKYPSLVHWVGLGLDTSREFSCTRKTPLMRNKSEFVDYLDSLNYLAEGKLYRVENNLEIEDKDASDIQSKLEKEFDIYKQKNMEVLKIGKLAPDSITQCHKPGI